MQFPGALSLMTLLVSFAIHTRAVYPPPNDYLMSDHVDWTNGYLSVYSANGKDAFRYGRDKNQPNSGTNRHRLMDGSGNQLFEVYSANEGCLYDWEYNSMFRASEDQLARRRYKRQSRGFSASIWYFNFLDSSGNRQYYKFNKNQTNKGGRIYKTVRGKDDQLEGLLRGQHRRAWEGNPRNVDVFTLSINDGAPLPEMVMLMALVLIKSNDCWNDN
ncbi:hypothetical protein MJO28_006445 [Puccinia striiformis f. sp. tritici]|uniref:Uncharacterized protein n=2 Tax=Puccinia striiformis f. sp. tritici TaxID=168172 RepID=A0A0L0VIH2_9BASI|nr:hypothetical protein Pst134EA_011615 [Puccinia striiformis f. sp. tritici]KAI9605212.1 hypothetical protein H4Q26_003190 [Puccinia striiformis f. sp. tritici PST-130]KNE99092.1 hypothetical protein PSTG_07572 [Puccinia striiformis f. sp. tritici PST-78]KAH9456399.1 hypothetical protein Pst134EB_012596 [Puccinia striiformis f. sp. tritici]KAH9467993.1 hypothetical protein Pst134EA_011615 [Puccinia striiformis f. sp. tritici]KAI7953898.1 hypothetical protein MJO28_006445 [Puccinia striiformis